MSHVAKTEESINHEIIAITRILLGGGSFCVLLAWLSCILNSSSFANFRSTLLKIN